MAWRLAFATVVLLLVHCNGDDTPQTDSCVSSADCDGLVCTADLNSSADDLDPLSLICSAERQGLAAAKRCSRSWQCASGICLLAGSCAEPCGSADDCASRERCQDVYARGDRGALHGVSACVSIVDLPDDARVQVFERSAAFSGGDDAIELPGSSDPTLYVVEHLDDHSWPIPPSDTSCRPPLCALTLAPLDAPSGELWFDSSSLRDPDGPFNPVAVGDHVFPLTVLVPNGPRAEPTEAGYALRVETKKSGDARITQISRAPSAGQLDLNLFYVGAAEFEDTGDEVPDTIATALDEIDRIFEPAGVFVGEVRQIHVTGALLEQGAELPDAAVSRGFAEIKQQYRVFPQLPELFKLSAGAGNAALNVFLVGDIDAQGDADIGAITGATPVPFGMHGTGASGIAVAANPLAGAPERLGRTLAHELGHAFGLFHTTETNGDVFDPLPDTPVCKANGGLTASDCEGAGAENLMFPTTSASASRLTEDQIAVIRRAMILK